MPNRILHERICTSETLAALTAEQEVFFYRLLVQCDDHGRFDGRPAVIRARCYPLQLAQVDDDAVRGWLDVLAGAGLIQLYQAEGRAYLQVTTWSRYQQTRAQHSKYPPPPAVACTPLPLHAPASNGNHLISDASNGNQMCSYPEANTNTRSEYEGDAPASATVADATPPEPIPREPPMPPEIDAAFTARGIKRVPHSKPEAQAARRLLQQGSADELAECWDDLLHGYGDLWDAKHRSFVMLERHNRFGNWLDWRDQGKPPLAQARASPKPNGQVSRQAFSGADIARQVKDHFG